MATPAENDRLWHVTVTSRHAALLSMSHYSREAAIKLAENVVDIRPILEVRREARE